jgi:hypothetical protein
VDANALTFNASLGGMLGPSGVRVVAALGLVLVTAQAEGALYAFALAAPFAQLWRVGGLENADNLAFDEATSLAWVSAGGATFAGGLYSVLVPPAASGRAGARVGGIAFPAAAGAGSTALAAPPQDFRLSAASSLVYACAPSTNSIVVASRARMQVVTQWSLGACCAASDPYALEIDSARGRLFVATYGSSPGPGSGRPSSASAATLLR